MTILPIFSPPQRRFGLGLILLVGALLCGTLILERRHMNADSLYYLIPFTHFMKGEGLVFQGEPHTLFPPGFGMVAYPAYLVLGDFEWTGVLTAALAYLLFIGLAYAIAFYLYRDESALLAAFWVMIHPVILWHSYQALSDVPYAVMYLSAYALFLRIILEKNTLNRSAALGFLCGMLYLTRPEGLAVGGLLLPVLGWMAWHTRKMNTLTVFLIPLVVLVGAYVVYLHDAEGEWTISGKVRPNIIRDEYVEGRVSEYDDLSVSEFIDQQGWKYVKTTSSNLVQGTIQFLGINRHVFFVFGVVWLVYRGICRRWLPEIRLDFTAKKAAGAAFLFFIPIFAYPFFYIDYRFFIPHSVIVIFPLAFLTLKMLREIAMTRKFSPQVVTLATIPLSLLVLIYAIFPFFQDTSLEAIYTEELLLWNSKAAGQWLADYDDNPDAMVIVSPGKANVIAFYAGNGESPLPPFDYVSQDLTLPEIIAFMQEKQADYLVIERNYQATNPALWVIWQAPDSAQGLQLLHREARFQVYTLTPPAPE